jgi:hypothetical protein
MTLSNSLALDLAPLAVSDSPRLCSRTREINPARARSRGGAWLAAAAILAWAASLAGCADAKVVSGGGLGGTPGGAGASGSGGTSGLNIDTTRTAPGSSSADGAITTRAVGCDGGDGCSCPPFNVAVLGKPGKWGANPAGDPDTALQEWLSSSSAGTAQVDNFTKRTTLTSDFLATYNVIILASLSEDSNVGPFWTFTDAEAAAFRAWLENGGGVISMTSYAGDPGEITPVNQLIGFSGVTYNSEGVWGPTGDPQIYNCNQSNPLSTWNRDDPVIANLSTGVTMIGFTNGRTIASPADGHVAATVDGKPVLVGKLVGKGRVLAYGDEWISYTSQWTGAGNPKASDPSCQGYLAKDKYQTSQFWYNMIHWSQPDATCFTIVDTYVPITIW